MRKKVTIVVVISILALIFVIAGFPSLKYLKEHKPANLFKSLSSNSSAESNLSNQVIIDISVEDICLDPLSGETELVCASYAACQSTCKKRGCSIFGLKYSGAEFKDDRCYCKCVELSINALS
jgi:hypothetical protein